MNDDEKYWGECVALSKHYLASHADALAELAKDFPRWGFEEFRVAAVGEMYGPDGYWSPVAQNSTFSSNPFEGEMLWHNKPRISESSYWCLVNISTEAPSILAATEHAQRKQLESRVERLTWIVDEVKELCTCHFVFAGPFEDYDEHVPTDTEGLDAPCLGVRAREALAADAALAKEQPREPQNKEGK